MKARLALACAITLGYPVSIWGQVEHIRVTPGCSGCEFRVEELLSFQGVEGELGGAHELLSTTRDSLGRFWMVSGSSATVDIVDSNGLFIGSVGRRGGGPGEFQFPTALVPVADSVLVFDAGNQRVTVINPELRVSRSFAFRGQVFGGVHIQWPLMVLNAAIPTGSAAGYPYHIFNLVSERIEKSFGGAAGGDFSPPDAPLFLGQIALHPNGQELITVSRARFEVQRWTLDGELLQSFTPDAAWFPPQGRQAPGNPNHEPDPVVWGISFQGDDLLVAYGVPRSNWQDAWRGLRGPPNSHPSADDLPSARELYQPRAALIDMNRLVVTSFWDHEIMPKGWSQPPGLLVEVSDDLVPVISVRKLQVIR